MTKQIERSALPELQVLRRLLCDVPDSLVDGARVVDADAQGPTGVDIILTDEGGTPALVDIVTEATREIPVRIVEHEVWLAESRRLFLRAYSREGIVRAETPVFVFVAEDFPSAVMDAVASLGDARVILVKAECFTIDGEASIALSRVNVPEKRRVSSAMTRRTEEMNGSGGGRGFERHLGSDALRTLFALFRSGIDGLDGRIAVREANGGMLFELGPWVLASVAAAPGSFTVAPGASGAPIDVSDRVSLERALNAVVSLFVREGGSRPEGGGNGGGAGLAEAERAELARIWGSGVDHPKDS